MMQTAALIIYIILVGINVFFAWKLIFAFSHFRIKPFKREHQSAEKLPSVSVCIPARNETHAMTECLERVVASTYPKLEIIVLDDSSVDDTSILIKSFAHAGVRFVEGTKLPEDWLGKNHAYETLRKEASGTYILYMDVDTKIQPNTINQLVAYAQYEKADMVSVLPQRMDNWRSNVVFSGLRYFWTLIFHRKTAPAVASNAWMIKRSVLDDEIGGLSQYRLHVQPEERIAAALSARSAYRFVIGSSQLGVSYEKRYRSFVETNIRLLYPLIGGRFTTGLLAFITLLLLCSPLVVLLSGFVVEWTIYQTLAAWQLLLFGSMYALYLSYVWRRGWWLGIILWPVALVQDTVLFVVSAATYATGRVTWKGRPVTAPKVVRQLEK